MKKTILIVEDEENIRKNIKEILITEGYNCLEAAKAEDALKILETNTPDLILSDIMMPGMDGYQFYDEVRKRKALEFVPFLFLSAKVDDLSVRTGMRLGADDYIKKPFSIADLLSSITTRLKKKDNWDSFVNEIGVSISKFVPHELRTPLVSILGNSNLLIEYFDSLSDNEKFDLIKSINRSGYRLLQRIEKFLKYSELVLTEPYEYKSLFAEKFGCDPSLVNLPALMSQDFICINREKDLTANLQEAILKIDEENFKIVLRELLSNACQYSPKGSEIQITGEIEGEQYKITVKDFGQGIPPTELGNIHAFYQLGREADQQVGNGLGLVIVKKLLKIFDGQIEFKSKIGEFTEVILKLPLLKKS